MAATSGEARGVDYVYTHESVARHMEHQLHGVWSTKLEQGPKNRTIFLLYSGSPGYGAHRESSSGHEVPGAHGTEHHLQKSPELEYLG